MRPPERRQHTRFATAPMYTGVSVRLADENVFSRHGHAYDLSEGGVRFDLDEPIKPGTPVAMRIMLPFAAAGAVDTGLGRAIFAVGNIVWADVSEPGPAQMAVAFTRLAREDDLERVLAPYRDGRIGRVA